MKKIMPKTAYDLCEMVAQHIEEDPLRYHQGLWGFEGEAFKDSSLKMPDCGTVCCRAGWIVALHDGAAALRHGVVAHRSDTILGYQDWQTMNLYYDGSLDESKQGTKAYARLGADGLRQWMREHAVHLKSRLLKDVPKA